MHCDGPLVTRHLELQINITRPCHELGISRPSKQSVIRALNLDHFKGQHLRPRIIIISKSNLQSYFTNRVCWLTRHHTVKDSVRWFKIFISQSHAMESFIIKDIDVASSVHEYLSEFVSSNLRSNYQRQVTRIINPGRVILTALENRMFRPS